MAPACDAQTLGDPEARTACNQIAFLPTELMLLREWKFASVGGGERLGWGVALAGVLGDLDGVGRGLDEHTRTRLSGCALWRGARLKTIPRGWPHASPACLSVLRVWDGQKQQGDGSDSPGLLRLSWPWWWLLLPGRPEFKFCLLSDGAELTRGHVSHLQSLCLSFLPRDGECSILRGGCEGNALFNSV